MNIKPYQTPLAWVHLRWMEDYRLEKLVELYREKKLQDYLAQKVERAEDQISLLVDAGRTRPMAEEEVIGIMLAPPRATSLNWPREMRLLIPQIELSLKI